MKSLVGKPEFAENPEPRCPVIILADSSGSMFGEAIREQNRGLITFTEETQKDSIASLRVEVALISFGGTPKIEQEFSTVDMFSPPKLIAGGGTPMGEAILMGLDMLESRKMEYRDAGIQYYRPWIFLITDGAPTDEWKAAAQAIREGEDQKKFLFFAVGVEGTDMETLSQIAPSNRPPVMLEGMAFQEMFHWLSVSLTRLSYSQGNNEQVVLPSIEGWTVANS